jgi:DnaJ-class molecular chaperone
MPLLSLDIVIITMKWRDLNQTPGRLEELRKADPYTLFAVDRGADLPAIKRAYRNLVMTYHPDKADPFMRSYCDEVLKIINRAMARIEDEYRNAARR